MYNRPLKLIMGILLYSISTISLSQNIINISAAAQEGKVVISYDLLADDNKQEFDIGLYSSVNNYSAALRYVSGDVGKNQTPGVGKKIIWDPKSELTNAFEGEVAFEIRATILASPVNFMNPIAGASFKKGQIYNLRWEGADVTSPYELEILRNGKKIDTIGSIQSGDNFQWQVPKGTKSGAGYQVSLKQGGRSIAVSQPFKVRGLIPLPLLVGAPTAIAGTVIALLIIGGGDPPEPPPGTEDNSLPLAPEPGIARP